MGKDAPGCRYPLWVADSVCSFGRSRASRIAGLGIAVAVLVSFAVAPVGAALTTSVPRSSLPTVKSVVSATTKAIATETSVRFTVASTDTKTKQVEEVTEDAGKTAGLQSLILGKAEAFVRLTKTAAYLSGNAKGLSTIFGLPAKDVTTVGTKWILIKSGTTQYTDLAAGGTIGPLASEILPPTSSKVTVSQHKLNGQEATSLAWTQTSSSGSVKLVLNVAATGKSLPLQLIATTTTDSAVTNFGHWGESITVNIPTKTIAVSKLPA